MKNFFKKYYPYLINKYFIAGAVFLFILIFNDRNGLINQWIQKKKYNKVVAENEYYNNEIKKMNDDYINLFSNPKNLEKYAREKYLMKRDNEDVFIIVKK